MGAEVNLAKQFSVRHEPKIEQRCLAYLRPPEICTSKAGKTAMEDVIWCWKSIPNSIAKG
jgi:hypothetical protein